jgi:hypothetical protein
VPQIVQPHLWQPGAGEDLLKATECIPRFNLRADSGSENEIIRVALPKRSGELALLLLVGSLMMERGYRDGRKHDRPPAFL